MASSIDFLFGQMIAVAVLAFDGFQVLKLGQQALAQVARTDSDGIQLPHQVDGFAQRIAAERHP